MKIRSQFEEFSQFSDRVYTSSCNVTYYDRSFIEGLKAATPFVSCPERRGLSTRIFTYERPFEPVIHTGNENMLTWQPYVFGALLCTEIILVGYWLIHLVAR